MKHLARAFEEHLQVLAGPQLVCLPLHLHGERALVELLLQRGGDALR